MARLDPDLRRTWLFGPGADAVAHDAILASELDALVVDLEDFTPQQRRPEARGLLARHFQACRDRGLLAAVRINALEGEGSADLAAAMETVPDAIANPMAERATQIHALDLAITHWESALSIAQSSVEIVPVCETALGVVDVRAISAASRRVRCAILGSEDLANYLCAERGPDAVELDYARRSFVLACRTAGIEPIEPVYLWKD